MRATSKPHNGAGDGSALRLWFPLVAAILSFAISHYAFAQNFPADAVSTPSDTDAYSNERDDVVSGNKSAIIKAQQALTAAENSFGPDDERTILEVMHLARAYRADGQHANALVLYERALAVREARFGPDHELTATSLNGLSLIYQDLARYEEAAQLGRRALDIREKKLGANHVDTAASLNNLAGIYRTMGRYDAARPLYERAIEIKEKAWGPDHPSVATSLNNLALLHKNTGHYQKALPLYERALAITEKSSSSSSAITAVRLQNLAELYRLLGRYDEALPLYLRSLHIREEILGPDHMRIAFSLNNLARLYEDMGQYPMAVPLLKRALVIREKVLGPDHPVTAVTLASLADLHYAIREYAQALPLYQRALTARESALGAGHAYTAQSLGDLARLYVAIGREEEALTLYIRALAVAEQAGSPEVLWRMQDGMSRLLAYWGKRDAAVILGKHAVNTLQGMRSHLSALEQENQKSFIHNKENVYKDLAELLIQEGRFVEAQEVLSMLKEEEYFDFVRRSDSENVRATRTDLSSHEQIWQEVFTQDRNRLNGIEAALERARREGASETERQPHITQLANDARRARETLKIHLTNGAGNHIERKEEYHGGNEPHTGPYAWQDTLRQLGPGVVLLQYVMSEGKVRILLTTTSMHVARESPTAAKDLRRQISLFRDLMKHPGEDPKPLAQALYRALIAPVAADLERAGARTLMLSLDGPLRYLPMAALHDGERYLIESYALAINTDAAKTHLTKRPAARWRVSALGLTRAIDDFSALPSVRAEIDGILKTGMTGYAHFDREFTVKRLRQSLEANSTVLHVSSHFVLKWGTDTDSYLLIGDGSRLSLRDIREGQYNFSRLDLLTLSACETAVGGGKDSDGREIEGLGVLAQRQGARSVLATLWPVADRSTSILMPNLYRLRHSSPGMSKAEALRHAQLALIQHRQPKAANTAASAEGSAPFAHPFYWAPFVLMGNWL